MGVSAPAASSAVVLVPGDADAVTRVRPGPNVSYLSALMSASASGNVATMPQGNCGAAFVPGNFADPPGSFVHLPVHSGIAPSAGIAGGMQSRGKAPSGVPCSEATFPRAAFPAGSLAVSKDNGNVSRAPQFGGLETLEQATVTRTVGKSGVPVGVRKGGAPQTTNTLGSNDNARVPTAPAPPRWGSCQVLSTRSQSSGTRPAMNVWTSAGYTAIAPSASSVGAPSLYTGSQAPSTAMVKSVVATPEKGAPRSQGSPAQGVTRGAVPIATRQTGRGVTANRLILPANSAASPSRSATIRSQAHGESVRQLRLSVSSSVGTAPRPILPRASLPGRGIQAPGQRVRPRAVTTATRCQLRPAPQPTLPGQAQAPIDYGAGRIPCGTQLRPTAFSQTPVSLLASSLQPTRKLLPENSVHHQQNSSACFQENRQPDAIDSTTGLAFPRTANVLFTVLNPSASLPQQVRLASFVCRVIVASLCLERFYVLSQFLKPSSLTSVIGILIPISEPNSFV